MNDAEYRIYAAQQAALAQKAADEAAATKAAADKQKAEAAAATLKAQQDAHLAALQERHDLLLAISKLGPVWAPLPVAPYPPSGDTTGFPRTGDRSLVVDPASITASQKAEPARVSQAIYDQAQARRPKLSSLFWIGICALGTGLYLKRR